MMSGLYSIRQRWIAAAATNSFLIVVRSLLVNASKGASDPTAEDASTFARSSSVKIASVAIAQNVLLIAQYMTFVTTHVSGGIAGIPAYNVPICACSTETASM